MRGTWGGNGVRLVRQNTNAKKPEDHNMIEQTGPKVLTKARTKEKDKKGVKGLASIGGEDGLNPSQIQHGGYGGCNPNFYRNRIIIGSAKTGGE